MIEFTLDQGRLRPVENAVNLRARRCVIGRVWLKDENQSIIIVAST